MNATVENVYLLFLKNKMKFNAESGRPGSREGRLGDGESRDREIQRYVLKGLVSSGHKHSSPSHKGGQSTPAKRRTASRPEIMM